MLFVSLAVRAQGVIDEVIWVVGDEAILRSEVEEERLRAQYEGQQIKGDPYCVIPEQMAVQKLFLHQAIIDSVEANESSVSHQVDMRLNYYINQIGSKEKMEEYFRKPSSEIREEMMTTVRNQMIIQQMQQKLTADIKPTPAEIRETERIKQRLREFTERVQNGTADFSMLARLYSEDTESAKRGGELGFVGRGQLVTEFADVAFNLNDPKRVSRIVQTEYGYHIIQLIEKKGERINCRHILLRPRISATDKINAINKLDTIRGLIESDSLQFEQAVLRFSQDKNTVMNAGLMINPNTGSSKFEYQDLAPEIAKQIYSLNEGDVSQPFVMMDPQKNREVCALVRLKKRMDVHRANITDDFQTIKGMLEQQKGQELLHNWILQKQKTTYVQIAPEWQGCDFVYPNWIH